MARRLLLAHILSAFCGLAPQATAATLSQPEIYVRCHSQFVRRRPSPDDELLSRVKAGKLSATDACMRLIEEAELKAEAPALDSLPAARDERRYQVLRTFQAFHAGWFPVKDFVHHEAEVATTHLFDSNEMAYHLSYNLLALGTKYSDVVLRRGSFRGLRHASSQPTYIIDEDGDGTFIKIDSHKWLFGTKEESHPWTPKLIQFGKLYGIEPMKEGENVISFKGEGDKQPIKFDATKSLGAGILGTISYAMLTSTQLQLKKSDDGLSQHRSWSKAVFSDLLCRALPVVRKEDARSYVRPGSSAPFQREQSCMQCHASTDPFAGTLRNTMGAWSVPRSGDAHWPRILVPYPTAAAGLLHFRDYKGRLVRRQVAGLAELGRALSETDDLYLCAAKRYFAFMTGIDVTIGDFSVPPLSQVDAQTKRLRDFVIGLGLSLKREQSLRRLVRGILDSPFYSQSDYGARP